MGDASDFRIAPLSAAHDRTSFASGEPALDEYIQRFASQDMRRRVSQVFVATSPPDPRVIGYYTLSGTSFSRDELAPDLARRLPRYPVPAAIIGPLPEAIQEYTDFSTALGTPASLLADQPAGAAELRDFLHGPEARAAYEANGLETA